MSAVAIQDDAPAVSTAGLSLLGMRHLRIASPFAADARDLGEQADLLADCIGAQIRTSWRECGTRTSDIAMSSTVLSGAIAGDLAMCDRFFRRIEKICGIRPVAIVQTYMCTGWGYLLRFFAAHTKVSSITIVIADVDVHNFVFRREHMPIGKFGFGITTVVLGLSGRQQDCVQCGGPYEGSAFNELVRSIKQVYARRRPMITFVPYLREDMVRVVRRVLGEEGLAPNRYPDYGHCFGSDTWIGAIEEQLTNPATATVSALMGAIAFNGYFTTCQVQIGPDSHAHIARCEGDVESLSVHGSTFQ